jgi:predicted RNase H-like HicB family nuclease
MRSPRYILLTVRIAQEGDQWAAECVELGTAACGDSIEEARAAMADLIALHLNALEEVGTCERFLRTHGIAVHRTKQASGTVPVRVGIGEFVTRFSEPVPCGAGR